MGNVSRIVFGVAVTALCASIATADPVLHGTFVGDTVTYIDVTESSGTDPVPPSRYGMPTITGNTLDFDPTGFTAQGINGSGDITDIQLNYDLQADPGTALLTLNISEAGDYSLTGAGTDATQVTAGLSVYITILEVDGSAVAPVNAFLSTAKLFTLTNDGPVVLAPWDLDLTVDFAAILAGNNIAYSLGVTKVEIAINNGLIALSETGSAAFIAKKDFVIETESIPEPASMALLGLAALVLAPRRRAAA